MLATLLLAAAMFQTGNPCDSNASGPFVVTSARSFTVQWCTANTRSDASGNVVPEDIDGFYLQVDTGPKNDIALAVSLGLSTVTQRNGWQYVLASGVAKGTHSACLSAFSYVIDQNGVQTTQRLESPPTCIPFTAVDPVVNQAPLAPTGGRIIR